VDEVLYRWIGAASCLQALVSWGTSTDTESAERTKQRGMSNSRVFWKFLEFSYSSKW